MAAHPHPSNQELSGHLNNESLPPLGDSAQSQNMMVEDEYKYPSGSSVMRAPPVKVGNNCVKELIQSRQIKVLDPIQAIEGGQRFDICQVMRLEVTLPLSQLLNESQQL